jgi:hypothetical protein
LDHINLLTYNVTKEAYYATFGEAQLAVDKIYRAAVFR